MIFNKPAASTTNAGGNFIGKATSIVLATTLAVSSLAAPALAFADEDENAKRAAQAIEAVEEPEQAQPDAGSSEAPAASEAPSSADEAPAQKAPEAPAPAAPSVPAQAPQQKQPAPVVPQPQAPRPENVISVTVPLDATGNPQPVSVTPEEAAEEEAAWEDTTPDWNWPLSDEGWVAWDGTVVKDAVRKGIDVSQHQGQINWEVVKAQGIDFAIIRCGYGSDEPGQDDTRWEYNVSECERLGIPYGVYLYSYADSVEASASEAAHVLRLLEGHTPDLPVYYDMEESFQALTDVRNLLPAMAYTFCTTVQQAGYQPGVYANLYWWNRYLTDPVFENWEKWVAQYNTSCAYTGEYKVWQASSKMSLDGITSRYVDVNFDLGGGYFRDVDYEADYVTEGALEFVTANGLMGSHRTKFQFAPEDAITRAEAVELLFNMSGRPEVLFAGIGNPSLNLLPFDDVAVDAPYAEAVRWARAMELLEGLNTKVDGKDNMFKPDAALSRGELCQLFATFTDFMGIDVNYNPISIITVADGFSIVHKDIPSIGWAIGHGILPLEDVEDAKAINPLSPTTRATMAHAAYSIYNLIKGE